MKAAFFWIPVLTIVSGLSAAHVAFGEPNNVHKIVAAQQTGKSRTQLQNFSKPSKGPYTGAPKASKPGLNGKEVKKSSSGINGTTIRRKH